jgi:Fic family protein
MAKIPAEPPSPVDLVENDPIRLAGLFAVPAEATFKGEYRHWDTFRHLRPPEGFSNEDWWLAMKLKRLGGARPLPLADVAGVKFSYVRTDEMLRELHRIDQDARGHLGSQHGANPATRDRYIISSVIEEAIASSQLEGASTTRPVAKAMIRSGRRPKDRAERMILNNYRAIQHIRSEMVGSELTPDGVKELHRVLTVDTLDDPNDAGRIQEGDEERIRVYDDAGRLQHDPPPAELLEDRLEAMCRFANEGAGGTFVHPLVRAIALHFWLAYDHPFVDGNGRTARGLFYWSVLSEGYWLLEFVSISRILLDAPAQYQRAFLYTETDSNDLTYFILHQLDVLMRSIDALHEYLDRKTAEARELARLMQQTTSLNHRQIALLAHALRNPDAEYTYRSHAMSHRVVRQTARTDLLELEARGLLQRTSGRRSVTFLPAPKLDQRIQDLV